jgi:DUF971 family protein
MTTGDRSSVRPAAIEADPEAGLLRIEWQDGHESLYDLAALRPACPCAVCHGEMGRPGLVNENTIFTEEQTTLADMQEIGRYAVQPVWGDGHDTGYYTFTLLRALCPCRACTAD